MRIRANNGGLEGRGESAARCAEALPSPALPLRRSGCAVRRAQWARGKHTLLATLRDHACAGAEARHKMAGYRNAAKRGAHSGASSSAQRSAWRAARGVFSHLAAAADGSAERRKPDPRASNAWIRACSLPPGGWHALEPTPLCGQSRCATPVRCQKNMLDGFCAGVHGQAWPTVFNTGLRSVAAPVSSMMQ